MSNPATAAAVLNDQPPAPNAGETPSAFGKEHSLYIKRIPLEAWERARHAAISSHLSFRDFVIRVLLDCQPYLPVGTDQPANTSGQ